MAQDEVMYQGDEELVIFDQNVAIIQSLTKGFSVDPVEAFNLRNGESKSLNEIINVQVMIKDILGHPAQVVDRDTGLVQDMVRIIFDTDQGLFSTCSRTVYNQVCQLMPVIKFAIKQNKKVYVTIKQRPVAKGTSFTINLDKIQ